MIDLDTYSGTTDDEKLDKAIAASVGSRLNCVFYRPLRFAKKRAPWRGVLQGQGRAAPVTLDFDSRDGVGWIHAGSSLVKQMVLRDIRFLGNGTRDAAHPALFTQDKSSPGFQQLVNWNVITDGLLSSYGTGTQRLSLTACNIDGPECDINNGWSVSIHVGGSDNVLWRSGLLLDSPGTPDGNGHEPGTTEITPHLKVGYLDKSSFGRVYCTATGRWRALEFDGQAYNSGSSGGNSGPVVFDGVVLEGRNKDKPSDGPAVVITGGQPVFYAPWFGYVCGKPESRLGVVECRGGYTRIHSPTYGNAAGVSPEVPFLYATGDGTQVRITDGSVGTQAGRWPDPRPRYRAVSRAAVRADATYIKLM